MTASANDAARPVNDTLLEGFDLHFAYPPRPPVVCGASLALRRAKLAALIGANGSGKSTLIRLLMGLMEPERGRITFNGSPLATLSRRWFATRVAYVPQANPMTFPFTALEVVLTGRSPYTARFRFENEPDCRKSTDALEAVDALHLAERPVTELSGGERQLVAVARALAQEPVCILLDEPSSSLDLKHRARLIRILARLRDEAGLTALLVTHDLQLLDPVFDYVFALRRGAVIAQGSPAEILRDSVLSEVYDDAHVRALRAEGHTFVWSGS